MLVDALLAAGITLPYWLYQKATKQPVERSKVYRSRLFTGVFGTMTAVSAGSMIALAVMASEAGDSKMASIAGKRAALPAAVLVSGLLVGKEGWLLSPFKKYEEEVS